MSRYLWNPKVNYSIHKSTPLLPNMSHTNPVPPPHPTNVFEEQKTENDLNWKNFGIKTVKVNVEETGQL